VSGSFEGIDVYAIRVSGSFEGIDVYATPPARTLSTGATLSC